MKRCSACLLVLALVCHSRCLAEVSLACGRATLKLSAQAEPLSLLLKPDNTECLNTRRQEPFAEVQSPDGAWHAANALRQQGEALVLGFRDTDTRLTLAVEPSAEWLALRVARIEGARPAALRFVLLNAAFTETVGTRLNIGWNSAHALCVMAVSPLTDTRVLGKTQVSLQETVDAVGRGEGGVIPQVKLCAAAQDGPGPKMEGAAAAIIACPTPEFKRVARAVSQAYGLPVNETAEGVPVKDTELVRGSYFFMGAGLAEVDTLIRYCGEAGIRQVMLNSGSWCSSAGHYGVNTKAFPNGLADLQAFVARLKAAGITAGMHCRVDQETSLPGEMHERLAGIFNACGFGMVYFDGGEDVDRRRFDYYASKFQASAMGRFNRPVIHMGTVMTHRLWHSFARGSTVDTYLNTLSGAIAGGKPPEAWPTVRAHVDKSVAYMLSVRGDMMPGELGWFGVWPRQQRFGREVEGLQLDEAEYVLCRSVAFDCPVSLQTSFKDLQDHPLTPEILRLFKAYETARLARRFTEAETAPMREPGKDFILLRRQGLPPVFVAVRPVACGNSRDVHAMVGTFEGGSVATFWHAVNGGHLTLDLSPLLARVADFDDARVVALKSAGDKLTLPVSTRRLTLLCPKLDAAALEQKIENSLFSEAAAVYK